MKDMVEKVFDDIRRIYDIRELRNSYFPTKEVERGVWLWKHVKSVPDRYSDDGEARAKVRYAGELLEKIGSILGRKISIGEIEEEEIIVFIKANKKNNVSYDEKGRVVDSNFFGLNRVESPQYKIGKSPLRIIDNDGNPVGSINFDVGISKCGQYCGPYMDYGGIELIVSRESIRDTNQFVELQEKL